MQCLTKEQSQFNGERIVFSKSGAEATGHLYGKNNNSRQGSYIFHKNELKWTIDPKGS